MRDEQKPVVKGDGSLLFDRLAPSLPGYQHDPDNAKRLIPVQVPCKSKVVMPLMEQNGKYSIVSICSNTYCDWNGKHVNDDICKGCPLRSH